MLTASPTPVFTAKPEIISGSSLKHDSDSWLTFSTQEEVGDQAMRKTRACYFGRLIFLEENCQNASCFSLNQNPRERENFPPTGTKSKR